ncbi:MAG: glutamate--tRNA ligase [Thermoleophilia bacterium]|nr:glutamate--tRNA ligase [Thermoleophilia bacterium]
MAAAKWGRGTSGNLGGMTSPVRVRFAPSPTGTLHLGSARSALNNWLFARHHGANGTYVLRIEDTDQERSTPENVEQALRVFRWLGMDWDEGPGVDGPFAPYFQSQRQDTYGAALGKLMDRSAEPVDRYAYPCFCTKEQLAEDRAAADAAKRPFIYTGRCRNLDEEERANRVAAGDAHVIRFRIPDAGTTVVHDLVLGDTSFENALIGDFVIARADGSPLYNFANVVDDAAMEITHVIRGNDHLSNTPKQILLYEALGAAVPAFAHLPMVLGPDGAKLSKRRHHTSTVEQLAESGYSPEAVRNALALIGWSKDDVTNVMSTAELIEHFDITRVKKSAAAIDYDKLSWLNGEHLRAMSVADWAAGYEAWRDEWLPADHELHAAAFALTGVEAALLVQEKCVTWGEVPAYLGFLLEPFAMSDEAWARLQKTGDVGVRVLEHVVPMLETLDDFGMESLEAALRGACDALELKPGKLFGPVRFAVTGQTIAPGLWESMHELGRTRTIERLRAGRDRLAATLASA